jgi:hypothetical protein
LQIDLIDIEVNAIMKLSRLKMLASFFLAGVLTLPAWAAKTGQPGSINYVEGQVSINAQPVDTQSIGSLALRPGQSLTTGNGRAEMLLTPGVFLRVDGSSSVEMLSASLIDTKVKLREGRAMVEVTEIHTQNDLRVTEDGVTTQLEKTGLYDFDAAQRRVRVFSGKAVVFDGDHNVTVGGGHEVDLTREGALKAEKFNKDSYRESDLYRWSSLRSAYLAEANVDAARVYVTNGYYGPGWFGAGWYWDPWYGVYTFIPADGIFFSPFGWGFYSPLVVVRSPVFFSRGPFVVHHFSPAFRPGLTGPRGFAGRPAVVPRPVVPGPSPMRAPSHPFVSQGPGAVRGGGGGFHGDGGVSVRR